MSILPLNAYTFNIIRIMLSCKEEYHAKITEVRINFNSFEIEILQKMSPGGNIIQPLPSYFWCVSK